MKISVRRMVFRWAVAALVAGATALLFPRTVERLYAAEVTPCTCSASCFFQSCQCSGMKCNCYCGIFYVNCDCKPLP